MSSSEFEGDPFPGGEEGTETIITNEIIRKIIISEKDKPKSMKIKEEKLLDIYLGKLVGRSRGREYLLRRW